MSLIPEFRLRIGGTSKLIFQGRAVIAVRPILRSPQQIIARGVAPG